MFQKEDLNCLKATLEDAGCDSSTITRCIQLSQDGKEKELIRILMCQRCRLIEDIHKKQAKIDCLDYYIYQLKKVEQDK